MSKKEDLDIIRKRVEECKKAPSPVNICACIRDLETLMGLVEAEKDMDVVPEE